MCSKSLKHFILVGATATGKGTLAKLIMKTYEGFVHISPGNILRLHVRQKTPLGQQVQRYLESGTLVPDNLVVDSVFQELKKAKSNHWLLDGFPRSVSQARILHDAENDSFGKCGFKQNNVTAVFNLILPDEEIIKRISNRWVHLPSGRIYNDGFQEPRVKWKDDLTGEDLVQRADDKPEVVAERLKVHRTLTEPVLDFYRTHRVDVFDLSSERIETVWTTVNTYLKRTGLQEPNPHNTKLE